MRPTSRLWSTPASTARPSNSRGIRRRSRVRLPNAQSSLRHRLHDDVQCGRVVRSRQLHGRHDLDMLNPSVRDTFTIPETPTENFAFTMNESQITADKDVRIARLLVGADWEPQSSKAIDDLTTTGILATDGTLPTDLHPLASRSPQRVHELITDAMRAEFGLAHFDRYTEEYRRSYHDVAHTVHSTSLHFTSLHRTETMRHTTAILTATLSVLSAGSTTATTDTRPATEVSPATILSRRPPLSSPPLPAGPSASMAPDTERPVGGMDSHASPGRRNEAPTDQMS